MKPESLEFWLILTVVLAAPARGQIFQVNGGNSTLFQATGGSVEVRSANYQGWIGAGSLSADFRVGASFEFLWRGVTFSLGDEVIPFRFPTDVTDSSHYFLGRGVGLKAVAGRLSVFAFGGATSTGFAAPFFRGARSETGAGLWFMDARLTPRFTAFSRNIISSRQTSISGFEWKPRKGLATAMAGGVGANQPYGASSLTAQNGWATLQAGYTVAGDRFRRVTVRTPLSPETTRENFILTLRPKPFLGFVLSRQNFLQPAIEARPNLRATVENYSATARAAGFTLAGSLFHSRFRNQASRGESLSLGRSFFGRLEAGASLFHSRSDGSPSSTSFLSSFREVISPRLSLLELVTHTNGTTSVSFGGDFTSNRLSLRIEYQTVYVPFRTADPFKQALLLSVRLQPFGSFQLSGSTYVAPDGAVRYTIYGGTFLYRGQRDHVSPPSLKFSNFLVRGRAVDEGGNPVPGVALRVDGDLAFTDSEGKFFVRKKRPKVYPLAVDLEEFLVPGSFDLISAPKEVKALPEALAGEVLVVIRKVPCARIACR